MLRAILRGTREQQHSPLVLTRGDDRVHERHLPGGDRSGLVEHGGVDATRRLEHLAALDHDAQLRGTTRAHHDRGGRGQAERARAGDDQHGDRGRERLVGRVTGEQPDGQGAQRDQDHGRHEDGRDLVREPLHRGLGALRLGDQPPDLGQRGLAPDMGRFHDQPARRVHRRPEHRVPDGHVDRDRLSGEHRDVDRGRTVHDPAVRRDLLARTYDEAVADGELVDGDLVATLEPGRLHAQREEGPERVTRTPARTRFEVLAEQEQRDDRATRLEVDVRVAATAAGHGLHAGRRRVEEHERDDRPQPCCRGAERHEGVHRDRAVAEVGQGRLVERPAGPEDHGRRKHQRDPLPAREHERGHHRDEDQRDGEHRGDDETRPDDFCPESAVVVLVAAAVVGAVRYRVAEVMHLRAERVGPGGVLVVQDGGRLGGQVHPAFAHAVEPAQATLEPAHAGRAGHPLDREIDPLRLGMCSGMRCGHHVLLVCTSTPVNVG